MSGQARFKLTLAMTSDWRIGSGRGRQGDIDSLIARDADGLPFVPATTARGVWRDAAEQLAFGLDDGKAGGPWSLLVTALFGSQPAVERAGARAQRPTSGRLRVDDLRLPDALRTALRGPGNQALRDALTFVKPGVAIDDRTGSASPDFLRFDEMARKDCVLCGDCRIDTDDPVLAAFAVASLALVERIGGNRRRGTGASSASVADPEGCAPASVQAAIDLLRQTGGAPATASPAGASTAPTYADVGAAEFVELPLVIRLESAVIATDRVLGNVVGSLDHVPGDMLLPVLRRALDAAGLDPVETGRMISNGEIRVAAAHPEIEGGRGAPVPFSWESAKSPGATGSRMAHDAVASAENPTPDTQLVPMRSGYVHRSVAASGAASAVWTKREVSIAVFTHNAVEDVAQKPNSRVGGLFTFEAIAAGQRLRSALRLPKTLASQASLISRALSVDRPVVGRAARAGYGRVAIEALDAVEVRSDATAASEVLLWFVSDVCLSPSIPASADAASGDLRGSLEAELRRVLDARVIITDDRLRARRRESWSRGWGLPRFSLLLLAGGSVARIKAVSGALSETELRRLEIGGVGARRAEGYGEVRIVRDADGWTRPVEVRDPGSHAAAGGATAGAGLAGDDRARSQAERIEEEAWRRRLAHRAEVLMAEPSQRERVLGFDGERPRMSQLGTLRSLLNGGRTEDDIEAVRGWLASLDDPQWERSRPLLQAFLDNPFAPLAAADAEHDDAPPVLLRSRSQMEEDPALRRYAISVTLLAAIGAEKRARERGSGRGMQAPREGEVA